MNLKLYTDSVLNELKTNRETNILKYDGEKFVIDAINGYDDKLYSLDIQVDYPELDDTIAKKTDEIKQWNIDCNNAILLHKKLFLEAKVPMMYLSDERFIAYLAHDVYWDFMKKRWPVEGKKMNRIEQKYFLPSGGQGFTRNFFLRMFWYTYITYQPNAADPYELTRIAFEYADPVNQIMERNYGRNQKIVLSLLNAIKNVPNSKLLNSKRTILGKTVNNILSIYSLDCYSMNDLINLFENEIKKIIGSDIIDTEELEEE